MKTTWALLALLLFLQPAFCDDLIRVVEKRGENFVKTDQLHCGVPFKVLVDRGPRANSVELLITQRGKDGKEKAYDQAFVPWNPGGDDWGANEPCWSREFLLEEPGDYTLYFLNGSMKPQMPPSQWLGKRHWLVKAQP